MVVYLVEHLRESATGEEIVKTIGVYSTPDKANEAVARTRELPGFSEYPNGFTIDEYQVDEDNWTSGFGV